MKNLNFLFCFVFMIFTLTINNKCYSQDSKDGLTNLASQPYINYKKGFKIHAPKGWRMDAPGQHGEDVIFRNFQTDRYGSDRLVAIITVTSKQLLFYQSADLDNDITAEKLAKLFQNGVPMENRKVRINGGEAKLIGITYEEGTSKVRQLQLVVQRNRMIFYITGMINDETNWEKYGDLIESSLLSFELN